MSMRSQQGWKSVRFMSSDGGYDSEGPARVRSRERSSISGVAEATQKNRNCLKVYECREIDQMKSQRLLEVVTGFTKRVG